MKAELPKREPDRVAWWQRTADLRAPPRAQRAERTVDSARRTALCQRRPAHGPLPEHGAQGHVREDRLARRQVREVRARLGHARPADRARDAQALGDHGLSHDRSARAARELQRTRALLARPPARAARAHGQLRSTSIAPTARSIRRSRRRSSTRLPNSPSGSRSTRACARRSGAFTTKPRSPKPRSSTSRAISPSIYVRFTADDASRTKRDTRTR